MAPNSLVFLVILGVWAAYLGKYWMRRREHLATARSMDRFSESIRVLRDSSGLPATDLRRPGHRSYAVTPATSRPQVLVKRTVPSAPAGPAAAAPTAPAPAPAPARRSARRVPRPVRGVLLLASLVLLVVSVPMAAFWGRFPWWGSVVLAGDCVAAFLFLRAAVRADLAARRRPAAGRRTAPAATRVRPAAPAAPAAVAPADVPPLEAAEPVAAETALYDIEQVTAPARPRPAARVEGRDPVPVLADDDIPETWDPRPVPRPTYALKQRAGEAWLEPAAVPTPVELDDDVPAEFVRRASNA